MRKLLLALAVAFSTSVSHAALIDHAVWDQILQDRVSALGYVDYQGMRAQNWRELRLYLTMLSRADLSNAPDDERIAFWINAYNAHLVRLVIEKHPVEKVSEIPTIFTEKFKVAGYIVSLNDIEHRIFRSDPTKGGPLRGASLRKFDPRIHFALCTGAVGSPRLINRAYRPESVRTQLQANAVEFANSPRYLRVEKDKLVVNALMSWYEKDFTNDGGPAAYLLTLTDPLKRPDKPLVDSFLKSGYPDQVTFDYDWTLNDRRNERGETAK